MIVDKRRSHRSNDAAVRGDSLRTAEFSPPIVRHHPGGFVKRLMVGCAIALAALPALAKEQIIPLSGADAALLQGKTVALTLHERPDFVAMTGGKAAFGLLGVGVMIKAGNTLVDSNHIADPAGIIRENLAAVLHNAYGAQILPADSTATSATKPKALAALHADADYVLDVRSGGWMHGYYATKWASYWVGYSAQVQLIDAKTGVVKANEACNASTQPHANPPSRDQLYADGAKLLKDVTGSLGWMCVQLLAKEELHAPADAVPTTPAQYADPLSALAPATPADATTPAAPAARASTSAPASNGNG